MNGFLVQSSKVGLELPDLAVPPRRGVGESVTGNVLVVPLRIMVNEIDVPGDIVVGHRGYPFPLLTQDLLRHPPVVPEYVIFV